MKNAKSMIKVLEINGVRYTRLYAFDDGVYFVPIGSTLPWFALFNDGSQAILYDGVHHPTNYDYKIIND